MNFIKSWNDRQIRIREDRYVCLTDMAQAVGKLFGDWSRLKSTKSYLTTLSGVIRVPVTQLVQIKQGGTPDEQGTWGHPKVAIRFAQWCSDEFALQVDFWVDELINAPDWGMHVSTTENHKNTAGFVYLATTPKGWCKIGMSKQPYRRMSSLQTGTPLEITLVHRVFTFDMPALEKALHDYYSAYWMRGEWFDLPDECVSEFPSVANALDATLEQAFLPQ